MKEDLIRFKELEEVISVYTRENADAFDVGICLYVDDEYVIFNSISKYGEDDGLFCIKLEDIFRISYGDKYSKMIKKLWKTHDYSNFVFKENAIDSILNYAIDNNKMVYVESYLDEDAVTGYAKSYTEDVIKIECFDEYGEKDGFAILEKESISVMTCNSLALRKIESLK